MELVAREMVVLRRGESASQRVVVLAGLHPHPRLVVELAHAEEQHGAVAGSFPILPCVESVLQEPAGGENGSSGMMECLAVFESC